MTQSAESSNSTQETEDGLKSSSWSNSTKYWFNKSKEWSSNIPSGLKSIRENGPKSLLGLASFSLFFILGLITLGASLLAGIAAVIMMKWQQHKAETTPSNVAESTTVEQQTVPIDVA